jgi:hypothetical protein
VLQAAGWSPWAGIKAGISHTGFRTWYTTHLDEGLQLAHVGDASHPSHQCLTAHRPQPVATTAALVRGGSSRQAR